jgi:hypothetical protein
VYATRAGSKLIDWPTVDVATMIERSAAEDAAASANHGSRFTLFIAKHLENTPAYKDTVGTTSTSTPTTTPTARDYG